MTGPPGKEKPQRVAGAGASENRLQHRDGADHTPTVEIPHDYLRRRPMRPNQIRDLAFERDVVKLCHLGPRAIAELLRDVGAQTMRMTAIESKVADFADLDPGVVDALGGNGFARPPLTVVTSADDEPAA
jgi:hypothetical protein